MKGSAGLLCLDPWERRQARGRGGWRRLRGRSRAGSRPRPGRARRCGWCRRPGGASSSASAPRRAFRGRPVGWLRPARRSRGRPRRGPGVRSARAPWARTRPHNPPGAPPHGRTVSASTAGGRASRARRITWACARVTAPSRIPAASTGRSRSNAPASARSARASANRVRVWCASHPAASFAPVASARSPASARTRNRSSTSCASAATSSRRATALSSTDMNVGFAPATPFSRLRMSEAAARIG